MLVRKLNHAWRWLGTAFSFFIFGVGGICLPLLVFPTLYLLPGSSDVREQRAQKVIHKTFRFYIRLMRFLGVLDYKIEAPERLVNAKLILANHPSLIDVVFLIAMVPNANCVVKSRLLKNPFMRGPIKAAGYIINDEAAEDVITAARDAFNKQHALIVFPEGTRTTPNTPLAMKRGAANIAIRAQADITPVLIGCTPTTLTKQDKWYQVPETKVHFWMKVQDEIKIAPYIETDNPSRSARNLTKDLTHYFTEELSRYERHKTGTETADY